MPVYNGRIFPDRDGGEWVRAWEALRATGRELGDYMLMGGVAAAVPGGIRWDFKNITTRDYVHIPADPRGCSGASGPFHRDCPRVPDASDVDGGWHELGAGLPGARS